LSLLILNGSFDRILADFDGECGSSGAGDGEGFECTLSELIKLLAEFGDVALRCLRSLIGILSDNPRNY
jgi:hypothetical protein